MNDYEQRRQARIDRLRDRASAKRRQSGVASVAARNAVAGIEPGQPILVGHHSEGRHRRAIERADAAMRKSIDCSAEAEELERRANAAEVSTAISSDDPDALTKLRAKLAEAEANADAYAHGIKIGRKLNCDIAAMRYADVHADVIKFVSLMGFLPTNANNRAEVKRIKDRIAAIEASQARGPVEPKRIGDVEIREEENRVRVVFAGKPSPKIIGDLKARGFRWSALAGAWQRHASADAWHWAEQIASWA